MLSNLLYITWNVDPVAFSIGSLSVRWYGILWAIGIYLAYLVQVGLYKKDGCPEGWPDKIFTYMVVGVIIGARVGHCWFYEWHEAASLGLEPVQFLGMTFNYRNPYIEHPLELIKIWQGGLASHGGAAGLIIAAIILDKKHFHQGIAWIFDRLVIGVAIAGALIRLGNLMNSEIYGGPTSLPWGFIFVRDGQTVPCHPTQIYEMIYCIVALVVSYSMYRYTKAKQYPGLIFGVWLLIVFGTRFALEFIKFDQEAFEQNFFLNMGQVLSLPLIIWAVYLLVHAVKAGPKEFVYPTPAAPADDKKQKSKKK